MAGPGGAWSDEGTRGDRLTPGRVQGRAAGPRPVAGPGWRGEAAGGGQQQPPIDGRVLRGAGEPSPEGKSAAAAAAREGELGSDLVMTASSLLATVRAQAGGL